MIRNHPNGIIIEVRVRTNSPRFSLSEKNGEFFIEVTSPPQEGKANTEIVKSLRKLTGHDVEILKGLKSKNKLILIKGARKEDIEKLTTQ
jgi:uncharacterized protein (TIGR00251 family)